MHGAPIVVTRPNADDRLGSITNETRRRKSWGQENQGSLANFAEPSPCRFSASSAVSLSHHCWTIVLTWFHRGLLLKPSGSQHQVRGVPWRILNLQHRAGIRDPRCATNCCDSSSSICGMTCADTTPSFARGSRGAFGHVRPVSAVTWAMRALATPLPVNNRALYRAKTRTPTEADGSDLRRSLLPVGYRTTVPACADDRLASSTCRHGQAR